MFGMGDNGGGLGDFIRERFNSMRNHPFQTIGRGVAGAIGGPVAGQLAGMAFNRYNDHARDQMVNNFTNDTMGQAMDDTGRDIWNRPLDGQLGQFDGSGQGNGPLAQALSGGGGGYNGPTQSPFSGNYGNNYGQGVPGGNGTGWTQQGNPGGLLDFLGPAPQPGQGTPMNHQELMDHLQNQQNGGGGMGPPALYGVSNFMVGGSPVINGVRPAGYDPNQMAMAHHWSGN